MDNQEPADQINFLTQQNKELKKKLAESNKENIFEDRDINNKLSNYAQKAIKLSKGPLKSVQLQELLMDDAFNKQNQEALPIIRKYSKNIDGVKRQMLWAHDNVETHMMHRKQQMELDNKLNKKIKKITKAVEIEQENEKKPNFKTQSTLDQYFDKVTSKPTDGNTKKSSNFELSDAVKQGTTGKRGAKQKRKRKSVFNNENSNSQENGLKHLTRSLNKRLKLTLPAYSKSSGSIPIEILDGSNSQHAQQILIANPESSQSSIEPMSISSSENSQSIIEPMSISSSEGSQSIIEPMSISSSEGSQSISEPMSIASSEGSQSSAEAMSIASSEDSQSSAEPMSIVNSENSSNESVMSADDSRETVIKAKATKKLKGKVYKKVASAADEVALDYNRNEMTVPERNLYARSKRLR